MFESVIARFALVGLMALLVAAGCSSDEGAKKNSSAHNAGALFSTSRNAEGFLVQKFDANGNGRPDVIKYFEEAPDPNNPAITKRSLRKVEIDVNGDGHVNIRRFYDKIGNLAREELDVDLDTRIETINHYDAGQLARKEILDVEQDRVVATRFYLRGQIFRVEKDTNGNNKIDYWEYYEEGVLTRVGRDMSGDGRADAWQQR
ncbi:MAG: hypothetical protein H0U74_09885 [Bradymonadaceae bacterium]|nr:hypothetical protein [Lujinxingiaceae bacterium]